MPLAAPCDGCKAVGLPGLLFKGKEYRVYDGKKWVGLTTAVDRHFCITCCERQGLLTATEVDVIVNKSRALAKALKGC